MNDRPQVIPFLGKYCHDRGILKELETLGKFWVGTDCRENGRTANNKHDGGMNLKLNIEEKKILYAFGCENLENTIRRLKWITALTVDTKVKHRILCLARKLDSENVRE